MAAVSINESGNRTPGDPAKSITDSSAIIVATYMLWWLASIVPWFAVQVRRLRDQGRSPWLIVINLSGYLLLALSNPVLSTILFGLSFILLSLPGQKNQVTYNADSTNGLHENKRDNVVGETQLKNKDVPAADVVRMADGRYSAAGYMFLTLEQAQSFAARKSGRGSNTVQLLNANDVNDPRSAYTPAHAHKSPQVTPRAKSHATKWPVEHWVAKPTILAADHFTFTSDLVYYGTLAPTGGYDRHKSLIDPTLNVASRGDVSGLTLGYWPNYAELNPRGRRSYLDWLSKGRVGGGTTIGFAFIFFYGLERHLIKNGSAKDAPAIMAELRRLLTIYGYNETFEQYCTALLRIGELMFEPNDDAPQPSLELRMGSELPLKLRVHLGKKVAQGSRINADDALCWALCHPMISVRKPVERCFDHFCALWRTRFDQDFPKGLAVREPKARLKIHYRAASRDFSTDVKVDDLPDIGAIKGPISKFETLLAQCCEELLPISRFIGQNPDKSDSLLATALLPMSIRETCSTSKFLCARDALMTATHAKGYAQMTVDELLTLFSAPEHTRQNEWRALYHKKLPDMLDALGFGLEPDRRYGPPTTLAEETTLCLFPTAQTDGLNATRAEYISARVMVEIAVLAAKADGNVVQAEIDSIDADVASIEGLASHEKQRLRAYGIALLANPSKLNLAIKRLAELSEHDKDIALSAAIHTILADQQISPSEVRFLEGLYKALGRPQDEVYARLHVGATTYHQRPQPTNLTRSTVANSDATNATAIDDEKLARLQVETRSVSSLLASIFSEDMEPELQHETAPMSTKSQLAGLDQAHALLLLSLTDTPMSADAFEALCRANKLLPAGAIETINDWSLDTLGDIAVENDEMVVVQNALCVQIKNMKVVI